MKFFSTVILFMLWPGSVYSAQNSGEDSVKTYYSKEIVIIGEKIHASENILPSSTTVITDSDFLLRGGSSIGSVLTGIPSIFVRSYGGKGSPHVISMRGMGGEHTAVLLNGEQLTSDQTGLVDLGTLLTDDVDRIELINGGHSSLVGSNAVAGVMNIVTKKPTKEFHASAGSSLGSFGMWSSSFDVNGGTEDVRIRSSMSNERARNNYKFSYSDGINHYDLERNGADYSIKNFNTEVAANLASKVSAYIMTRYELADRGSPAGVSSPYQHNLARLQDESFFVVPRIQWKYSPETIVSLGSHLQYFLEKYIDPDFRTNSYSANHSGGISLSLSHIIAPGHSVRSEIEGSFAAVHGSEVSVHSRGQVSVSVSSEDELLSNNSFVLYPSIRIDSYQYQRLSYSPRIGMNLLVNSTPEIRLRGSAGESFRVPTFNELYYEPGGNQNLTPEQSSSADAGFLLIVHGFGEWRVENNYYEIDTKNRIVWTPGVNGTWSPMNVYRVISKGIEVKAENSLFNESVHCRATYTYMEVTRKNPEGVFSQTNDKQLVYTPFEMGSVSLSYNTSLASVALHQSYTGFRYINENNDPRYVLPSFQTTDIVAVLKLSFQDYSCTLKAEADNVFNSQYQWIVSYPVPGRSFALKIVFHY